jgi:hypothetical protein
VRIFLSEIMVLLSYELGFIEPACAIDCPKHVNDAMYSISNCFMCSRSARYLMMLEIEVFMQKYALCRILDSYSLPSELGISALWSSSP